MPKPWSSAFGSGAHINVSLADADSGHNLFAGPGSERDKVRYTDLARYFTAGVLRHGDALSAVLCPTVNSYKRLLPIGLMHEISWAPVYRAYGNNNRTLMCRLPANRPCLEVRTADSACNLYLGLAFVIAAGLEGVADRLDPGLPVDIDTYKAATRGVGAARGAPAPPDARRRPRRLRGERPRRRGVFGKQFHADFARYKRAEWDEFNTVVGRVGGREVPPTAGDRRSG